MVTSNNKVPKAPKAPKAAAQAQPTATPAAQATQPVPIVAATQVVQATLKAQATVAAQTAKNGGVWLPKGNSLATLQALYSLGATSPSTAVPHGNPGVTGTIAGVTGRAKGNNCRGLAAAGLVVQLNAAGRAGYVFYLTPAAITALQPTTTP